MPSSTELQQLFHRGKLGELITQEFKGQIKQTYNFKDMDFVVEFPSEEATPSREQLKEAIEQYYRGLGYQVVAAALQSKDSYDAVISFDPRSLDGYSVGATISTRYPLIPGESGTCRHVRATCQVLS